MASSLWSLGLDSDLSGTHQNHDPDAAWLRGIHQLRTPTLGGTYPRILHWDGWSPINTAQYKPLINRCRILSIKNGDTTGRLRMMRLNWNRWEPWELNGTDVNVSFFKRWSHLDTNNDSKALDQPMPCLFIADCWQGWRCFRYQGLMPPQDKSSEKKELDIVDHYGASAN